MKKQLLMRIVPMLLLLLATAMHGQTTIINYNFNSGSSYSALASGAVTGVTGTVTSSESFETYAGTATTGAAFTSNSTGGQAIAMANSSGSSKYFQFQLGGTALATYTDYKVYFQAQRSNTGAQTVTLQYSTTGSSWVSAGTGSPNSGSFAALSFNLSTGAAATALNNKSAVYFRIVASGASGAGTLRVDNFQVQASAAVPPTVTTTTATDITANTATSGGNVTASGSSNLSAKGVVWTTSSSTDPTISLTTKTTTTGTATGSFISNITGLLPNTTYYYRAYATNTDGQTGYGSKLSFTTLALPTVTTTTPATGVTSSSATAGGNVTAQGSSAVTAKGVVWSTSQNPTVALATKTDDGPGTGAFTSEITGLALSTTYYYRAYATNDQGTAYGAQSSFTTLNIVAPTVTTTTFSAQNDADVDMAVLGGTVTNNGGEAVTQKGFVWNTTGDNLNAGEETTVINADATASFSEIIEGLTPNTQYFYRAFATNSVGTGYGNTNNFYTHAATPGAPVIGNATHNTLDITINANGNPDATQYIVRVLIGGNAWYLNSFGSLQDTPAWLTGSTLITRTITGLTPGTTYIFDAKARNVSGIETPWSETTSAPTLSPSTPFFSLVESDLEFGDVCINTYGSGYFIFAPNNLQNNQQIAIYTLPGFTYSLIENGTYNTGLFINYTGQQTITVYVRFTPTAVQSYPETVDGIPGTININSASTGTLSIPAYGNGVNTPALTITGAASDLAVTSATVAAQATKGCPDITAYGIEYSTTQGFENGTGTQTAGSNLANSSYSLSLTGLTACTTYYYKSYVTDATGTYYGEELSFATTPLDIPVATAAQSITQTGFTAAWNAVEGATGYYVDISNTPDFGSPVNMSGIFDSFTASGSSPATHNWTGGGTNWTGYRGRPWTGSLIGSTSTKSMLLYGSATASGAPAGPDHMGGYIISDVISGNLTEVSFESVGSSVTNEVFTVAVLTGNDFTTETIIGSRTFTSATAVQMLTFSANVTGPFKIKIYRNNIATGGYILIGNLNIKGTSAVTSVDVTGTTHQVTDLQPDTDYYYRVRAYGGCTSGNSNTIQVRTLTYLNLAATDNLTFGEVCTNANETGSFTFSGNGITNADFSIAAIPGFAYSLTENGEYTPALTIEGYNGAETTVYVRFAPSAVQVYSGTIIVQGQTGTPYEPARLEIPVSGSGIYTPAVATANAATGIAIDSATLPGRSVAGNCSPTTAYGIEYSTTNNFANGNGTQIAADNIDENGNYSIILENLDPCETYYYKAYTTNAEGTVYSVQRSFTTPSIDVPVAVEAIAVNTTGFTASWDTVEGATGYRLDVATNPQFENSVAGTTRTETFSPLPAASSYGTRTWDGDNGISWQATDARTDYTINGRAILLRNGSVTNTSQITGGLSSFSLKYRREFSGNSTLKVFINGTQYGGDIAVSSTSASDFEVTGLNISGNIEIEVRNSGNRTVVDDISWTSQNINNSYYLTGYKDRNVGNATSLELTGLDGFASYYYRVRAYADNCATANSNTIRVNTKGLVTWKVMNGTPKWDPAFYPDGTTPVVIDTDIPVRIETDYDTSVNGIFTAKSLTHTAGTFTVAAGTTLIIENEILNNLEADAFIVENNGNLIQNNAQAGINSGDITVYRDSSPLYRQDYTMWSSPVDAQNIFQFSHVTLPTRFYTYNPSTDEYNMVEELSNTSTTIFSPGTGYLIRMPNASKDSNGIPTGTTANPTAYNQTNAVMTFHGKFAGIPNNGDITVPVSTAGQGFNLVGNPYPSPINIGEFLSANENVLNGTVWIWRKKNASANTAYCTINTTGQYVDNGEPNTGTDPNAIIRTGQGFIVQTNTAPAVNEIVFNNAMRSSNTSNQFFRHGVIAQRPESHGMYLNLTNSTGFYSQMYTGYIAGATQNVDNGIDSRYINDNATVLSTVLDNQEYIIHGRALPFNNQNSEPLQLRAAVAGEYTIAIDHLEGLFAGNQDIFIKDNTVQTVHNLKDSAYTFTTGAGTFTNRFEIVYTNIALGNEDVTLDPNNVIVYKDGSNIVINTGSIEMKSVTIFDLRGRAVYSNSDVNATQLTAALQAEQQVLIVQIKSTDNKTVSKKVIF